MSTENEKTGSRFPIVATIMRLLKLDEAGKLETFFAKQVKKAERQISNLEANKKALKLSYENHIEDLKEKLEDANEALEAAYHNVDVTKIMTNADQDSYESTYWYNIERAEDKVEAIENDQKEAEESYDNDVKEIDEQIVSYRARIAKITK